MGHLVPYLQIQLVFGAFVVMIVTNLPEGPENLEEVREGLKNRERHSPFQPSLNGGHFEGAPSKEFVGQFTRERIVPSAILALTKEQIEQLGFSAMEIVFDCGCFAETSKKTVLRPPLAVKM